MDALATYLLVVNVAAFALLTVGFLLLGLGDKEESSHGALTLFAALGGGAGMLLALLLWDRRGSVKGNVAWRYAALMGAIAWGLVAALWYRLLTFDPKRLVEPLPTERLVILGVYLLAINVVTFATFAVDKHRAEANGWRVRESVLLGLSLLGGAVGGMIAMRVAHHKTHVYYFKYGLPLMLALQVATFVVLRGGGVI